MCRLLAGLTCAEERILQARGADGLGSDGKLGIYGLARRF